MNQQQVSLRAVRSYTNIIHMIGQRPNVVLS
jgi:hypothetical protein